MKRTLVERNLTLAAFGTAMSLFLSNGTPAKADSLDFVKVVSHQSFSRTVSAIKKGVAMNKMMVVGEINQKKILAMNGLRLEGAETLFIGNPVMGKKLFSMNPGAGAAVPVRIYVWVDRDGKTEIGYFKPSTLLAAVDPRLGMGGQMLDDTLDKLVHMVAR
jgi:uncharacterized protein (DUF302 family)